MKYGVDIEDNLTGERRLVAFSLPWDGHGDGYWWREGNFSCDCNRYDVFYPDNDGDIEIDCDGNRFTVHKVILESGQEIIIDK